METIHLYYYWNYLLIKNNNFITKITLTLRSVLRIIVVDTILKL